ncbi:MAG: histidine phosphatase family protein [Burkholderiales bacterium]|nr:histidine phosphatase family protein [Burkholderiales bacterium]MDE2398251.1 histidine phosphatase family protein [Burkholderiales bacterium]MDE2457043.1 histidine phosphatase family protein [Burkholderiales bacterium]
MNEATRLLLIRHGETAWNVEQRIQGQLDIPLNDKGLWQAGRVAAALADAGIDAVYSSDLRRAAATAEALARAAGLEVVPDTGLRERAFGRFEGVTFREIAQRWPEDAQRWRRRDPDFGPGGGETLNAFYARCFGAATRLAGAHPGQTVALVAHGGVLDCLYRAAARIALDAPRTWRLGNASINRLLHSAGALSLVGWSDEGHLEQAEAERQSDDPGVCLRTQIAPGG